MAHSKIYYHVTFIHCLNSANIYVYFTFIYTFIYLFIYLRVHLFMNSGTQ